MSTISKKLSGFIFNGATLALGTSAFKANLNSIIGLNAAGTSYISYNPNNAFNSLTQLMQDGVYTVDAKNTGFDIPGATLTAVTSSTLPASNLFIGLSSFELSSPSPGVVRAAFTPYGPAGSTMRVAIADYSTGTSYSDDVYSANQPQTVEITGAGASPGSHQYQVFIELRAGTGFNSVYADFSTKVITVQ